MLSASICRSITPDLYDAAVTYEQSIKTFVSVLPEITDASSRPEIKKAEKVLEIIKDMKAKCDNIIDHKDPAFLDVKDALQMIIVNDLVLQKTGPFTEAGLIKARENAIVASNHLMALLVEIPTPVLEKSVAKKSDASDEEDDEEGEEDEGEDEGEEDDEEDEGEGEEEGDESNENDEKDESADKPIEKKADEAK